MTRNVIAVLTLLGCIGGNGSAAGKPKWYVPYDSSCTERQEIFAFTEKPAVRRMGTDRYEITFAVKAYCDVTISVVDGNGKVLRRLASGVLGRNAPAPFEKNFLKQSLVWDGKDDFKKYVRDAQSCKVLVSVGLKPSFERILGWHPYDSATWDVNNDYRGYRCMAADEKGVYVLMSRHPQLRHYDHNGKYIHTILPPAGAIPMERFTGNAKLEVEPGRTVLHGRPGGDDFAGTVSGNGSFLPDAPHIAQACIVDGWFVWPTRARKEQIRVHRVRLADGRYELWKAPTLAAAKSVNGGGEGNSLKLAASPDGRTLYVSAIHTYWGGGPHATAVFPLDTTNSADIPFTLGEPNKAGTDNLHLRMPEGVACDASGRVYVCDPLNHRIQVFSPAAKYLKTIPVKYPHCIHVDRKRGGIYVLQVIPSSSRRTNIYTRGRPDLYLIRLGSYADPKVLASVKIDSKARFNWIRNPVLCVDYWSDPVRIWLCPDPFNIQVYEDRGDRFSLFLDFQESTRKAGLMPHMMNMCKERAGILGSKIAADVGRDHLYYFGGGKPGLRYDLRTGAWTALTFPTGDFYTDRALDGKGLLYTHINGSITRHDPANGFREVPFDYGTRGVDSSKQMYVGDCTGVIALADQAGGKGYQDGFGVNIYGDMTVGCNIFYGVNHATDTTAKSMAYGKERWHAITRYNEFMKEMRRKELAGEFFYRIKQWPGRYAAGATIWVYDRKGLLVSEDIIGGLGQIAGVSIDNEGCLYTTFDRTKMVDGKPFLAGRGSVIGRPDANVVNPRTATFLKASPKGARIVSRNAHIPMKPWPSRPMDIDGGWVKGAEWTFAGAGPADNSPLGSSRHATDWYGRSFVPENYRYSVGILDKAGNLITHVGRYGNADDGNTAKKEIAFAQVFALAATDNYLCVSDMGNERIVVLKLNYRVEETVAVP